LIFLVPAHFFTLGDALPSVTTLLIYPAAFLVSFLVLVVVAFVFVMMGDEDNEPDDKESN
jgi:hypothetical protein